MFLQSLSIKYRFSWGLALLFLLPVYGGLLVSKHPMVLVALESFLAPLSIWAYLSVDSKRGLFFGFWVGLGLFYWCALSFRFNEYTFFLPLIMLLVALCYGVLFYVLLYSPSFLYRVATLWISSYIHPFGFDWMVPDAFFAYSAFRVDRLSFFCLSGAVALLMQQKPEHFLFLKSSFSYSKFFAIGLILLCIDWKQTPSSLNPHVIKVVHTDTRQELKWRQDSLDATIAFNLYKIQEAIQEKKQVVVLPETAFPIALNKSTLIPTLLALSAHITIITGALYQEKNTIYNSTYVFDNKTYRYAHKVILAPFGETMPFPRVIANYLDRFFFGSEVFKLGSAHSFKNISTHALEFRPLVCYEGTSKRAYSNSSPVLVVMSNNAWFVPSIEPFLQRMLLKYYARRFHKSIIHSANKSPSYILTPTLLGDQIQNN